MKNQNLKEVQTMQVTTFTKTKDFMKLAEEKNVVVLILNQWGAFFVRLFITNPKNPWIGYIQDYINQKETQVHVERLSSKTLYIPLNLKPQPQPQPKSQRTSKQTTLKSFEELAKLAEPFYLDDEEDTYNPHNSLISNVYFSEQIHPSFFKKVVSGILLKFHRQKTHAPATTEVVSELYMFDYEEQWKVSRIYASLEFVKDFIPMTDQEIEETIERKRNKQKELSRKFAEQLYSEYLEKGLISQEDFEKVIRAYEEHPEIFIEELNTEKYEELSQILDSEQEEKQIEKDKRLYQEEMNEIWEGYIAEIEEIENQIEILKNELYQKTKEIDIDSIPEEYKEDAQSILKGISQGYENKIKQLERKRRRLLKEYFTLRELYTEVLRYYYIDEEQAYSLKDLALRTLQKLK